MQSNMLDAKQVVTRRRVLRNSDTNGPFIYVVLVVGHRKSETVRTQTSPAQLSICNGRLFREDLEPHVSLAFPCSSRLTTWHFREVELQRAWVEDVRACSEANTRARSYILYGGCLVTSSVATDLIRSNVAKTCIAVLVDRCPNGLPV